jgi:hypothetical protein
MQMMVPLMAMLNLPCQRVVRRRAKIPAEEIFRLSLNLKVKL